MRQVREILERFLSATEDQVLDFFAKFPKAHVGKDREWVYVPGKRPDRVLLVAHADTVHDDKPIQDLLWVGDTLMRPTALSGGGGHFYGGQNDPLGADDRAGCAMLYDSFTGDHSLLITTGEEQGCLGAQAATQAIGLELAKHQFAIEIDRKGDRHAVFYDVSTDAFEKYVLAQLTALDYERVAWGKREGSNTDIRHICPSVNLCGVNLSAGFWNEHSSSEMLLLGAWMHTRTVLRRLLKQERLPQFKLPRQVSVAVTHYHSRTGDEDGNWFELWESCNAAEISKKGRKKLAHKIRKSCEKGKIQRWQAVRLLDKLFNDPKYNLIKEASVAMLPKQYAHEGTGSSVSDGQDINWCRYCFRALDYCTCPEKCMECKLAKGLHKATCKKFPGAERCKRCKHPKSVHIKVIDGVNEYYRCPLKLHCVECGVADNAHSPTCSKSAPIGTCQKCGAKEGHTVMCPDWTGTQTHSHIRGTEGMPPLIVSQMGPVSTCLHHCNNCQKSWRHVRLGTRCQLTWLSQCGKCHTENDGIVQRMEADVRAQLTKEADAAAHQSDRGSEAFDQGGNIRLAN